MQEKEMVNDYLAGLNASLAGYGGIIAQCENDKLRVTIQEMRNQDEVRQYALFKIAKEINPNKDIKLIKDNEEALSYAIDRKAPILITGSFYLAGPMFNILEDKYGVKC